ncbi:hypothetical protein VP01_885g7 [Puccinia sorghi]|uniref:ER-derived vesicles protein ERV14 n=1 Tax=Puccinia sorghi TaxID=27349 RepID=A0A0L6U896_9BASI|nr:hypothetical protein VP01_885g7 [Puccinia sorghi]
MHNHFLSWPADAYQRNKTPVVLLTNNTSQPIGAQEPPVNGPTLEQASQKEEELFNPNFLPSIDLSSKSSTDYECRSMAIPIRRRLGRRITVYSCFLYHHVLGFGMYVIELVASFSILLFLSSRKTIENLSIIRGDYLNPIDLCNKMNQLVATLINVPLVAWNVNKVMKKTHMYDATEIFRTLAQHKKESFFKLGFYLLSFFYYLFRMIAALVADEV